ncbi:Fe-S cluster assembly protein SufD [Natronospirillum operosum]|uniref:Fe-S cluster assembly protein SufD n=1 Tax=Natronospirillum operosum TaxID=2759953 RepID=A0A4Z0WBB5_9GAMM|nr:Fe-S cluster assembly protein SufD [Natronospirillum operosum]TGG90396.1 Fe-S cluster assembly protein SufD [Natronospirillum operosum]
MTDFQQQALQLAQQQTAPDWLQDLRAAGAERWSATPWPTRRTEHWKYTPLAPLQKTDFGGWGQAADAADIEWIDAEAPRLVFVNGRFAPALSSAELPAGVVRFADAGADQQAVIQQHLGQIVDSERHLFAALSNAWVEDGVLVHVPQGAQLASTVHIVHISTPEASATTASQRVLIVLEAQASASVVEHFASTEASQNGFVNSLTEVQVAADAEFRHSRVNLEQEDLIHVGGVHVNLGRSARMKGFTLAQGSRLKRIDYQVNHRGEGAELVLNGVYLPRNRQLVDYHTNIEHCVPHGTTSETFRGIIGDSARAVFNGRIHIHPDAQKTLAELSNKNLLTSGKAEVDTKPELEIYADDVRCAHGATVSRLDATALYYLQSRGISQAEAEVMLSFGFINELLREAPEASVQSYLRRRLGWLLGRPEPLARHLEGATS